MLSLEDGRFRTLDALVRDPVCGMLLDLAQAPSTLTRNGVTHYVCAAGCRDQFEQAASTHPKDPN